MPYPPTTDEHHERISNAEDVSAGLVRAKRVVLYDSSGNEIIFPVSGNAIVTGTKTVTTAGTAVRITAVSTPCKLVIISGDTVAGILCAVGDASVVANVSGQKGIVIIPGNDPVFIPINDLSLLYVDAASNGGKIAYAYLT